MRSPETIQRVSVDSDCESLPPISNLLPHEPKPGKHVVVENLDWKSFQRISNEVFCERPAFRLAYDRGKLQIMCISHLHARCGAILFQIVHVLCEEFKHKCGSCGSMTLDRRDLQMSVEPDHSFYITNEALVRSRDEIDLAVDPPPDLAIEISISPSVMSRLDLFAAMRIPEAWRFDGRGLEIGKLTSDGAYEFTPQSGYFPGISPDGVVAAIARRHEMDDSALLSEFRVWVREQIVKNSSGPAA